MTNVKDGLSTGLEQLSPSDFSRKMLISGRLETSTLYVSIQRAEDSAGRSCLVSVKLECPVDANDTLCESA